MNSKNKITQLVFIAITSILLISFTPKQRSYQTECVSIETDGYITIKIWNIEKGNNYKPTQARKDAIHSILYSGISQANSCSTQLPILNKTIEQENFQSLQKSFFANKGPWSRFTRSSVTETTLPTFIGNKNWKVYQVSVSKKELRKYLEERKIIKSLNNGF